MADSLHRHTEYGQLPLLEQDVATDPFTQFRGWLDQAEEAGVYEPNAMVLSAIDPDGRPSSRTVLLREIEVDGFEFFTSYTSHKGRALLAHPAVSVVFPWYRIHRQVIVHGVASPTDPEVSDAYFASRAQGAKIAALASDQSAVIASRELLEARFHELEEKFGDGPVPRPQTWGGFRIVPDSIEFWQGRRSRLHDRLRFTRVDGRWTLQRLQP